MEGKNNNNQSERIRIETRDKKVSFIPTADEIIIKDNVVVAPSSPTIYHRTISWTL